MNYRKIVSSILIVAMLMCTFTACSSKMVEAKTGNNIKTLDNQQKEINDVLSIKKIIDVEDFHGYQWLDDNRILGKSDKDGYENIAIYDIRDNTVKDLTDNRNPEKFIESSNEKVAGKCYYQYKQPIEDFVLYRMGNRACFDLNEIFIYDLKNDKLVKVDENVGDHQYVGNNQLYYTKGLQLFRYDLVSKSKSEIKLPVDLTNNLKSWVSTFEEYKKGAVKAMKEQGYSENELDRCLKMDKERYEYEKKNNQIEYIYIKGEEVQLRSFNANWCSSDLECYTYTYNMENNTFREGNIEEEYEDSTELIIGKVAKVLIFEDELWKIDNEGNNIKLIGTTPADFVQNFYLSPDETKLIYEVAPSEKREKIIYDFNTDKKITVSGGYYGCFFNDDSNKIIFNGARSRNSKIVILND
ncbi:hypothetical protein SH1V18_05420 [Vallitalea longa]|uniref:Lipoprotein n=1 Tax=Vallitalea longa TaxID=2936439 RepID=A0A9W5Y7P6_9FIRM|nr:hypothetical protein [Vallitalea longa]GKX28062.1 hypothetical protein SH1V18_05420 [Vallitalea longa]